MPLETAFWRLGETPFRIPFSSINTENRLETIIAADISIVDPSLMLIGRQVATSYGKFIDLLAVNADGHLVVLELKRDRTPREVVAQLLDYGSWVRTLEEDDIANIFSAFLKKYRPEQSETSLEEAFCKQFNVEDAPELWNESHALTFVASDLDDSTERIINYLSSEYGVAINAVFFRFFRDDDRDYLHRAWLIDPSDVETKIAEKREKLPWNGEFYVSFGHNENARHWEDARKYGFISAGGGEWYSRTLKMLEPGSRLWVNVPKKGYVGVGRVLDGPVLANEFLVEDPSGKMVPITELPLKGDLVSPSDNAAGTDEYLVRVEWLETVPLTNAIREKGFFGNQNSAAKPTTKRWVHTVDRLKQLFKIEG